MRASRTLALYLAREILQYGLLGFAAVSVVLITQNLLRRMDELTAVGFTLADLLIVLRCLVPMLTSYAIPIALLFGSAIAIRRLVADSEILAMRSCGLGIRTLLIPSLVIGAMDGTQAPYVGAGRHRRVDESRRASTSRNLPAKASAAPPVARQRQ